MLANPKQVWQFVWLWRYNKITKFIRTIQAQECGRAQCVFVSMCECMCVCVFVAVCASLCLIIKSSLRFLNVPFSSDKSFIKATIR